ncbi:hypothetical protein M513_08505, partial [Trichuris suis]
WQRGESISWCWDNGAVCERLDEIGSRIVFSITAHVIAKETSLDSVLDRVRKWTQKGWPRNPVPEAFKPFVPHRSELSVHKDCVLRDSRVEIPLPLRTQVLQLLHAGQPGIVWWPGLDKDVEKTVLSCLPCQENRHNLPRENEHRWPEARTPWSKIHVEFFGKTVPREAIVQTVSTKAAVSVLRTLFATHGIPDYVVNDNSTAFTSAEFAEFMKSNCIQHLNHGTLPSCLERSSRTTSSE